MSPALSRARLGPLLLAAAALGALSILVLAPGNPLAHPWLLGGLVLLGTAAGVHPWTARAGLGAGAAALPLALVLCGLSPAALAAAGIAAGADLLRRFWANAKEEPGEPSRALRLGTTAALSTAGAAAAWTAAGPAHPLAASDPRLLAAAVLSAVAFGICALALDLAFDWSEEARWQARLAERAAARGVDTLAWAVGAGLALIAEALAPWLALALFGVIVLLLAETERHSRRHLAAAAHADELRRLTRATERLPAPSQPMAAIADQIRIECRNLLPFVWFQFELPAGEGRPLSWFTGPSGEIQEGVAHPPPAPPAIPGFHRRGVWQIVERELRLEGEAVARLRLWCDARQCDASALRLLEELLPQMASSVHRALLDREAKQDPLTGAAVRRVLAGRLQTAFARAQQDGTPLALLMCDLDHFKKINDAHGHDAGDQALVLVARMLGGQLRDQDLLCRYGGEEFTLLLEGTAGAAALQIAERLRQAVEEALLTVEGRRIPLSVSVGVAAYPELHVKTGSELLLLADAALYQAKRAGRNRCLLDLGAGHYRGPGEEEEIRVKGAKSQKPPQIFI